MNAPPDRSKSPINYGNTTWLSAEPFTWTPNAGPSSSTPMNPPPYNLPPQARPLPSTPRARPVPPAIQVRPPAAPTPPQPPPKSPSYATFHNQRNGVVPDPQPYLLPPNSSPSPRTASPSRNVIGLGAGLSPQNSLRGTALTLQAIEQSDLPVNPPTQCVGQTEHHEIPTHRYHRVPSPHQPHGSLELEWRMIFNAAKHRVPILPATWFQDSWELSILVMNHILFTERSQKKRRVQIYDIYKGVIHLLQVKYDAAILSGDGRHLLVGYDKVLSIINVSTEKVIKKFKTRGLHVRKWTSHNHAFCWVDNDGQFWSWKYEPSGPNSDPEIVFRLQSNAPRYWMTPLASHDGTWLGICATEKDRRQGVVQLFPSDNSMARVFEGPAAAAFTEVHTERGKELAVTLLSVLSDSRASYIALDAWGLDRHSTFQEHTRCDVIITPSMKLSPEIYIDKLSSLAVTAVSTTATEGSIAMVFEPRTGRFVTSCRLNVDPSRTDKIFCGVHGIYMERDSSLFRRLSVYPEGRPANVPVDAEEYFFRSRSRRSIETWQSLTIMSGLESGPGTAALSREGTDLTSVSSGSSDKTRTRKDMKAQHTWGRGFMASASDESWMNQKHMKKFNRVKEADDSD